MRKRGQPVNGVMPIEEHKEVYDEIEDCEGMITLAKMQWGNEKWQECRRSLIEAVKIGQRLIAKI